MNLLDRLDYWAGFVAAQIEITVATIVICAMGILALRERHMRYRPPRRFVSRSAQRQAHRNGEWIRTQTRSAQHLSQQSSPKTPEQSAKVDSHSSATVFIGTLF